VKVSRGGIRAEGGPREEAAFCGGPREAPHPRFFKPEAVDVERELLLRPLSRTTTRDHPVVWCAPPLSVNSGDSVLCFTQHQHQHHPWRRPRTASTCGSWTRSCRGPRPQWTHGRSSGVTRRQGVPTRMRTPCTTSRVRCLACFLLHTHMHMHMPLSLARVAWRMAPHACACTHAHTRAAKLGGLRARQGELSVAAQGVKQSELNYLWRWRWPLRCGAQSTVPTPCTAAHLLVLRAEPLATSLPPSHRHTCTERERGRHTHTHTHTHTPPPPAPPRAHQPPQPPATARGGGRGARVKRDAGRGRARTGVWVCGRVQVHGGKWVTAASPGSVPRLACCADIEREMRHSSHR
jgi:hypothetical protein